ncbi:hypothetical protein ASPBRDRAFT_281550 [Aspergillus brasiliensis CBS 101740]|uniref:Oxidase ustYa n=1 Tax=Aspergillus brasiliensis (strain CBS 101740 / IMI 381727 / IBT 21946) TaxID=767769 RepID=A0A1L9UDD0_ASPBC|nr:hypothetical protein ASPBRDRAFT_281550 [Aspergillus brasiliensis CBS 101740]
MECTSPAPVQTPLFPTKEVIFWPHEEFVSDHQSNRSISEVGERWLSLLPNPKRYNLPDPIEVGKTEVFTPAVFHQLHCLYMIMHHYDVLLSNQADTHHTMDGDDLWHVDHCFDYLRQSIQCCSDTALEGQGEMKAPGTDGSGGVHICKDYESIRVWAEQGRITDLTHN